jgi:uracil-DNA glycosylase
MIKGWDVLNNEFNKSYFKQLWNFVENEYNTYTVHPDRDDIFNALSHTSYDNVKVVIIGQDPYINYGEAHGFSFSVKPGISIPPSLMNVYIELRNDLGCYVPNNGNLISWADQGVLLLNTILTVRHKNSLSHANKGWEVFTGRVLESVLSKPDPVVYLLWGKKAQNLFHETTYDNHLILKAAHPSPLAGGAFFGCKHFSKVNKFLKNYNMDIIDWQIKNI